MATAMTAQTYEEAVPLASLTPHPMNPNDGDVGLLTELLDANGFVGAVLAQKSTGIIIDGETRWRAAQATGMASIPVMWADVDDDTRDRLLASINESNRRGRNDEGKLLALLQPFAATVRGFAGTAFDGDDVDSLLARLNRPLNLGAGAGGDPDGGYAESDEERAERERRSENYGDRKGGGALIEMILVFTVAQRDEVERLLAECRRELGGGDRAAEVFLRAMRVLARLVVNQQSPLIAEAIAASAEAPDAG